MPLKLNYISESTVPVEADCITPDCMADLSVAEIEKLELLHGNAQAPLAEFFEISGEPGEEIIIEGDCSRVKLIGAEMSRGRIVVHGDVGMHLGAEMSGGEIEVHGSATDWVGAHMKGGKIHVHGEAGHLVGGAYRGSRSGMQGGVILIEGSAKNEIGCLMRRGLIAIGGDAGDFPGVSMLAGSIFIFGMPGIRSGAGMKRGTIAVFGEEPGNSRRTLEILPTFRYDCTYRPPFLALYLNRLRYLSFPVPETEDGLFRRYSGDLIETGKGEILVLEN